MRTTRSAERASAADIASGLTAASVPGAPRSSRSRQRRHVLELHAVQHQQAGLQPGARR